MEYFLEYPKDNQNATILSLTLLGRDLSEKEGKTAQVTDSSPSVHNDMIKEVIIIIATIVMLIAGTMLLQFKRMVAKKKKKKNGNNRPEITIQPPGNDCVDRPAELGKPQIEIFNTNGKLLNSEKLEISKTRPNRYKMCLESETPPQPKLGSLRPDIRCQLPKLRPVSLGIGEGWSFLCNPVARLSGKNRHGSRLDTESLCHSRLTVFENNAYEDTITSNFENRGGIHPPKTGEAHSGTRTPSILLPAKSMHDLQHAEECWDAQRNVKRKSQTRIDQRILEDATRPLINAESQHLGDQLFHAKPKSFTKAAEIAPYQSLSNQSRNTSNTSLRNGRVDKEAWVPIRRYSKIDTIKHSMASKATATDIQYCDNSYNVMANHDSTDVFFMATGSSNSPVLDLFCGEKILDPFFSVKGFADPPGVATITSSQKVDAKGLPENAKGKKCKKKRKVKRTRRERDHLQKRWRDRLNAMKPVSKLDRSQSYNSASNELLSKSVKNWSPPMVIVREARDSESSSGECKKCRRGKKRVSETTLLEEIWNHLSILVERAMRDSDPASTDIVPSPSRVSSLESSIKTLISSDDSLTFRGDSDDGVKDGSQYFIK